MVLSTVAGRNVQRLQRRRHGDAIMSRSGCGDFSNSDYGNAHNPWITVSVPVTLFSSSHLPLFRFSLILVELILDLSIFHSLRGILDCIR